MKQIKEIDNWEKATVELAEFFANKYFGKDNEHYFVADCIGDVLYINDRFFNLTDIVHYLKAGYSAKDMFLHYDLVLEAHDKGETFLNIKTYAKNKFKPFLEKGCHKKST